MGNKTFGEAMAEVRKAVEELSKSSTLLPAASDAVNHATIYGAGIILRNEDGTFESPSPANVRVVLVEDGQDVCHQPFRGSDVEAWVRQWRNKFGDTQGEMPITQRVVWNALDDMLEDYRLRADTGSELGDLIVGPARQAEEPNHGKVVEYRFRYAGDEGEIIRASVEMNARELLDKYQRAFQVYEVHADGYVETVKDRIGGGHG